MRLLSLSLLIYFFIISGVYADENSSALTSIEETVVKEFSHANLLEFVHPSDKTLQILYRAKHYDAGEQGEGFTPRPVDENNLVLGPRKKGFIITVSEVPEQPEEMEFQSDGIALEQNAEFTLWNEKIYSLMLSKSFLVIRIAYNEDVDWELVADIEDEILFSIDHLRVNYNSF